MVHNLRNSLSDVKFAAGAFTDRLAGEKVLAQYFLSVLNLSDEYQKWEKLSTPELPVSGKDDNVASHFGSSVNRVLSVEDSLDHTKVTSTFDLMILRLFFLYSCLYIFRPDAISCYVNRIISP